jgi:N-acetylglutamate synthase/N-acetylornithine aminotransferase
MEDSVASAAAVAAALGVDPADVLLESTGVIGASTRHLDPLPHLRHEPIESYTLSP